MHQHCLSLPSPLSSTTTDSSGTIHLSDISEMVKKHQRLITDDIYLEQFDPPDTSSSTSDSTSPSDSDQVDSLFFSLRRTFADVSHLQTTTTNPSNTGRIDVYAFAEECLYLGTVFEVEREQLMSKKLVGLAYISHSTSVSMGEANVGFVIDEAFSLTHPDLERKVAEKIVSMALGDLQFRRAQVQLFHDTYDEDERLMEGKMASLFFALLVIVLCSQKHPVRRLTVSLLCISYFRGFENEALRKGAAVHPVHETGTDVVSLAILDHDWFARMREAELRDHEQNPSGTTSVVTRAEWDALLSRRNAQDQGNDVDIKEATGKASAGTLQDDQFAQTSAHIPVKLEEDVEEFGGGNDVIEVDDESDSFVAPPSPTPFDDDDNMGASDDDDDGDTVVIHSDSAEESVADDVGHDVETDWVMTSDTEDVLVNVH